MSLGYFFKQNRLIGNSPAFRYSPHKLEVVAKESFLPELATFKEPVYKRNDYGGLRLTKYLKEIQLHSSKKLTYLKS